jgi:hypothetical protein
MYHQCISFAHSLHLHIGVAFSTSFYKRRVAYVQTNVGKAIDSLLELTRMKSCQPIGGAL